MQYYGLNELREMFLNYFEKENAHLRLNSFSLIPHNDKSLLLINSGMAPLKPYFTGQETPPRKRVTTCQKCIRTPDIENVGKTARHGTFFEMLGNFSFGDYFKTEAIHWAWRFLTEIVGIDKELLYVSVYENDDEAYEIWNKEIGLNENRIVRLGKDDNFWEIGLGPCGPCSEIYVDRGEKYGCGKPTCGVGCECDRFVEVWNLVFTQFDKDEKGNYNKLTHPNIDTGMGLERLAVVCQDADNLFEVDTIKYILDYICSISNKTYGENHKDDVSIRVITDHIRSVVFMLSDGVIPSNEGRGYVLRRLFRRAVRHAKLLGIDKHFMSNTALKVIETSKNAYPSLEENKDNILKMIDVEETRFNETISQGSALLKTLINELKSKNETTLDGNDVFKLYDTFGFPIELTEEIAQEEGLGIDVDAFNKAMDRQKAISADAHNKQGIQSWKDELTQIVAGLPATVFSGYEELNSTGKVICLVQNSLSAQKTVGEGECVVITDKTCFYATSGGQLGDIGKMDTDDFQAEVISTIKSGDKFAHIIDIKEGSLSVGENVSLHVNANNRMNSQRNHTCTHLLHKALKTVLGPHVNQAGSEVTAEHLRFDFSHFSKMSDDELKRTEEIVNEKILKCLSIEWFTKPIQEAKKLGATALFGEKYSDNVRVVKMGDYSMEFCAGCHLSNTGYAGMFKILSETGVAAGVRRIEAITGEKAYKYVNSLQDTIAKAAIQAKTTPDNLVLKISEINDNTAKLQKELTDYMNSTNKDQAKQLYNNRLTINKTDFIASKIPNADINALRDLSDKLKDTLDTAVILLVGNSDDKAFILCSATKNAVSNGFNCGSFIKQLAQSVASNGGGRPDMAQAGFKDISKIDFCVEKSIELFKNTLTE